MKLVPAVVLFGDLNVDFILPIAEFPRPGYEGISAEAFLRPGGSIGNTACLLEKLSVPARLVSKTGRDPWAEYLRRELLAAGVDVSAVRDDPERVTGVAVIVVIAGGERTMFSTRGANPYLSADEVDLAVLQDAGWAHISGYSVMQEPQRAAAWALIDASRRAGLTVSLDTGLQPVIAEPEEARRMAEAVDAVILGPAEAEAMYGSLAPEAVLDHLLGGQAKLAAVKLGSRGSWLADREQRIQLPALPFDSVDATGAGDAYCAGLIAARLQGLSLPAAGWLATLLGGLATTVWGAGPYLPGPREALAAWQQMEAASGMHADVYPEVLAYLQRAAAAQEAG